MQHPLTRGFIRMRTDCIIQHVRTRGDYRQFASFSVVNLSLAHPPVPVFVARRIGERNNSRLYLETSSNSEGRSVV